MEEGENDMVKYREWLSDRIFVDIWEAHGNRVIGLGRSFIELLNLVSDKLNDIHERDIFNGNLLENLRIKRTKVGLTWKVEFVVNPPLNISTPVGGIIADVQHFRYMVHLAKLQFPLPLNVPYPDAWLLYFKPLYGFDQLGRYPSLSYVKRIAFYNYSHPLFFNKVKMAHFIYKLYEIRKRNPKAFSHFVCLNDTNPLTDMSNWLAAIPINPSIPDWDDNQPPLRQVLYYRTGQPPYDFRDYYQFPCEVTSYLRTVCEHARDVNQNAWSGKILKELHQVLPDALPKIHFLLCSIFNDEICLTYFGADNIGKLMRHGPFGYKGLKF